MERIGPPGNHPKRKHGYHKLPAGIRVFFSQITTFVLPTATNGTLTTMKHFPLLCTLLVLLLTTGCNRRQPGYLIGVSQCSEDDWRTQLNKEITREAQFYNDVKVEIRAANDDSRQQINDINELLEMEVDLLIVSPNVVDDVAPAIDKAYGQGIPVILVDRRTRSDQCTAYIGANNYDIGKQAGEYIANRLQGKGHIVELTGLKASTPAIERHRGLQDALKDWPGIEVTAVTDAEWREEKATTVFDSLLSRHPHIDLVFAHNDRMAAGAYRSALQQGREKEMLFIGIDALPGKGNGVDMVSKGQLDATFIYPTGGDKVMQLAMNILQGKPYERENILSTALVNRANARIMQMQTSHIGTLDDKIEMLNRRLDSSLMRYSLQRMLLVTCIIILVLAIALLIFITRAFWSKKRMNATLENQKQQLEKQKGQLEQQRDQLIELSQQLEKATQAKLSFFTSVSHDFRTPLTLIIDPINQLLDDGSLNERQRYFLDLIRRNATILRTLINQILDFRKFEEGKLELQLTRFDLAQAMAQWTETFRPLSFRKHIHLKTDIDTTTPCPITADVKKLERIVYNLLANAFKYTHENGSVRISLQQADQQVTFQVEDTGIGIDEAEQKLIFESFYQTDNRHEGTGIGLALVKAFVDMHHGSISVNSRKGKGSTFTVALPVGAEDSLIDSGEPSAQQPAQFAASTTQGTTPVQEAETPATQTSNRHAETVLIIDDNPDIRSYARTVLENDYNVLEADNGQEGLRLAQKYVPDVVVCDVMMPVMDGIECCRRLKSEMQTSHIPVIMLTAYALDEQKIKGYECGADSYLSKPFNAQLLKVRIRNLIDNRRQLQDFFSNHPEGKPDMPASIDKTFLEKLHELISQNLSDSQYNVETMGTQIGLSRVQLYRKCKALTNYGPNELLRIARLKRAAALLAATEKSVSEIAYEVGFTSPSYFAKCYKEYFGKSPTESVTHSANRK